jgi:hypothetical protein
MGEEEVWCDMSSCDVQHTQWLCLNRNWIWAMGMEAWGMSVGLRCDDCCGGCGVIWKFDCCDSGV